VRRRRRQALTAPAVPSPNKQSTAVPGSGTGAFGVTTLTVKGCDASVFNAEGVAPPRIEKLPEYSPAAVPRGTETMKICAVTDWSGARAKGKFTKNGVSSNKNGAAIFKVSPFKNVELPPVSATVPVNVTLRPGCVVSSDDASVKEIGVARAASATSVRDNAVNRTFSLISPS
jgi:hypothetical protein